MPPNVIIVSHVCILRASQYLLLIQSNRTAYRGFRTLLTSYLQGAAPCTSSHWCIGAWNGNSTNETHIQRECHHCEGGTPEGGRHDLHRKLYASFRSEDNPTMNLDSRLLSCSGFLDSTHLTHTPPDLTHLNLHTYSSKTILNCIRHSLHTSSTISIVHLTSYCMHLDLYLHNITGHFCHYSQELSLVATDIPTHVYAHSYLVVQWLGFFWKSRKCPAISVDGLSLLLMCWISIRLYLFTINQDQRHTLRSYKEYQCIKVVLCISISL